MARLTKTEKVQKTTALAVKEFTIERLVKTAQYENVRLSLTITIPEASNLTMHEAIQTADDCLVEQITSLRSKNI